MHGGGGGRLNLSAAAQGDNLPVAGADVIHPAPSLRRALFPSAATAEIEAAAPPLPRLDAASLSKCLEGEPGDEAMCFAGDGDVSRRRPLGSRAAAPEIEELPPSPSPSPEGVESLMEDLRRGQARLAVLRSQLEQLRRGNGAGAVGHELGMVGESLSTGRDRLVALRLQVEEMEAFRGSLKGKIGGTCNWKRIVFVTAFISGLVLLIRALLPVHYLTTHTASAVGSMILNIAIFRQLSGTSMTTKGFSRHVSRFMCVCSLLLALYVLYLYLRLVGGTSAGLLGKHL